MKLQRDIHATTFAVPVTKKKNTTTIEQQAVPTLVEAIIHAMSEGKAEDIVVMNLQKLGHSAADYFIICQGNSGIHSKSICDSIERETIQQVNEHPIRVEGIQTAKWILMDYGNVIVHIFDKEARSHYALEELWGDAAIHTIPT